MTPVRRTVPALLVVLALAGCGGGSGGGTGAGTGGPGAGGSGTVAAQGPPDAQTAAVAGTTRLTFSPATVTARPGTLMLTLGLQGGVPHDLAFQDASVGKDIPVVSSGSSTGTFRFPKAGTYEFVCTLHDGMSGKVVVAP